MSSISTDRSPPRRVIPSHPRAGRPSWQWGLTVLLAVFAVYLLTHRGLLESADELALFGSAESLAAWQTLERPQLLWAEHHNPTKRYELLFSLVLAPVVWLAIQLQPIGSVQAGLLLSPLATAGAAGLLFVGAARAGASRPAALLVALTYAFATTAWFYANTLYRDAFIALLLMSMVLLAVEVLRRPRRSLAASVLLAALGLVATRMEYVVPVMAILAYLTRRTETRRFTPLWAAGAGLSAIVVLGSLWYRGGGLDPRATEPWLEVWSPLTFPQGLYGLTLAPGTSPFLFAPPLLLALWALRRPPASSPEGNQRRVVLLLSGVLLLTYASFPAWSGVISFGPRFLVPLFAPLLLLAVPEIDRSLHRPRRAWLVWLLIAAGVAIQLGGALFHDGGHYVELSERFGPNPYQNVLLSYRYLTLSPALHQFREWKWGQLRPVWLTATDGPTGADWVYPLGVLAILGVGLPALRRLGAGPSWRPALVTVLGLIALFGFPSARATSNLLRIPLGDGRVADVAAALQHARAWSAPDREFVVSVSPAYWHQVVTNFFGPGYVHVWLSPEETTVPPSVLERLQRSGASSAHVIMDRIPPESPQSHVPRQLDARLFRAGAEWFGPYLVYDYATTLSPPAATGGPIAWGGGLRLERYELGPTRLAPGSYFSARFELATDHSLSRDLTLFFQLVGPVVLSSPDARPGFGAHPTGRFTPGRTYGDQRAIRIPPEAPTGRYEVRLGFYDDSGRLPLAASDRDFASLGGVEVVPAP